MQNKEKPPNNEGPSLFLSCSTLSKNHHARTSFFFYHHTFFSISEKIICNQHFVDIDVMTGTKSKLLDLQADKT